MSPRLLGRNVKLCTCFFGKKSGVFERGYNVSKGVLYSGLFTKVKQCSRVINNGNAKEFVMQFLL